MTNHTVIPCENAVYLILESLRSRKCLIAIWVEHIAKLPIHALPPPLLKLYISCIFRSLRSTSSPIAENWWHREMIESSFFYSIFSSLCICFSYRTSLWAIWTSRGRSKSRDVIALCGLVGSTKRPPQLITLNGAIVRSSRWGSIIAVIVSIYEVIALSTRKFLGHQFLGAAQTGAEMQIWSLSQPTWFLHSLRQYTSSSIEITISSHCHIILSCHMRVTTDNQ